MDIDRTDPLSKEMLIKIYNATHEDSQMSYKELTVEEIIKRYGDVLTDEQIKILKNK